MPNYSFDLQDGNGGTADTTGVSMPDRQRALAYAQGVVGELMRGRELETRSWRLDVYENAGDDKIFTLPFATLDHTLDHLTPELRRTVETLCECQRSFAETVRSAVDTVREARALVARSRGKPYVAAEHGKRIIRHD